MYIHLQMHTNPHIYLIHYIFLLGKAFCFKRAEMKVFGFPWAFLYQRNWETSHPRTAVDDGDQLLADCSSPSDHQMYV